MQKYTIENGMNFYEELNKSIKDDTSSNYENICQITGSPLIEQSVTLECKHSFNYVALYTEICRQKFDFKTYSHNLLTKQDYQKVIQSKLDYFIRCPYCRNIQFTLLPHYPELKLQEHYGINTLDKIIYHFGVPFKAGKCCHSAYVCSGINVAPNPISNISYCINHYIAEIKNQRIIEKQASIKKKEELAKKKKDDKVKKIEELTKKKEELVKKKEELTKKKEDKIFQRIKLLEEMNAIRVSNGLPILKRLPRLNKQIIPDI